MPLSSLGEDSQSSYGDSGYGNGDGNGDGDGYGYGYGNGYGNGDGGITNMNVLQLRIDEATAVLKSEKVSNVSHNWH